MYKINLYPEGLQQLGNMTFLKSSLEASEGMDQEAQVLRSHTAAGIIYGLG